MIFLKKNKSGKKGTGNDNSGKQKSKKGQS